MRALPAYHTIRIILKYVHIVSSALWLGTGASILLLLSLYNEIIDEHALIAFNLASTSIDNYLLIPSACISMASGVTICIIEDLDMFSCSWIITKCVCAIMAIALGTFIAPVMYQMSGIVDSKDVNVLFNLDYYDILTATFILVISQLLIILFIIFISIKRPCTNFRNCKQCRESRLI
jgi:large-conductance mechanosensitive channel